MLTIELGVNPTIEERIFGEFDGDGERVLLINDGVPIGTAVFTVIGETAKIVKIGILSEFRNKKYGDFFTRALLYKLSLGGLDLAVNYSDDYFLKFGFIKLADGTMRVANKNLRFPTECGSH